ncbi:MAG: tetratricopeptide repeat protein [Anaerolineae bacterium]|nr:tetratricopeptide repeat protein [Anaerolineae bacterium]
MLAILAGLGILLADFVLENQESLQAQVVGMLATAENQMATMSAPTPTPGQDPMLCLSRANAAYEAGNMSVALDYYDCAVKGMPNDIGVHYQRAFLLITSGYEEEGLKAAREAIMADPTAPHGYAIAGMALDWLAASTRRPELYNEALAYVLKALEIDENFADAHAFLAEIYADQARFAEAEIAAQKALEIDPDNYKARRNYGSVLEYQADYEGAADQLEQAIRLNPKLPYLRIHLARLYFVLGKVNDALDLLLQAVQITGGDAQSYYWLGHGYLQYQGDYPSALSNFETCVEVDPDYRPCWERLGGLLIFQQEYDRAANAYARAIDLGSTRPSVFYYAAISNQLIGRCDNAVNYARRGLELAGLDTETESDMRQVINECRGIALDTPTPDPETESQSEGE